MGFVIALLILCNGVTIDCVEIVLLVFHATQKTSFIDRATCNNHLGIIISFTSGMDNGKKFIAKHLCNSSMYSIVHHITIIRYIFANHLNRG
jgi:hypothetical protein